MNDYYVEANVWNAEGEYYDDSTYVKATDENAAIEAALVTFRDRGMVDLGEITECRLAAV